MRRTFASARGDQRPPRRGTCSRSLQRGWSGNVRSGTKGRPQRANGTSYADQHAHMVGVTVPCALEGRPMHALDIARWQFGITTVYHFIFVPITIGLSAIVA